MSKSNINNSNSIYLDYNATTPLEPEVLESIHQALKTSWGNPSSCHQAGISAKRVIDEARKQIADMVGGMSEDIIFTSGGTEANNLVLHTAINHYMTNHKNEGKDQVKKPHIITSVFEHDSIKKVLDHFEEDNIATVTFVPASKLTGRVEAESVIASMQPNTCLVTVMMANNETGIIQPIKDISERLKIYNNTERKKHTRILMHTDAAQTIGKVKVDVDDLGVDYLTIVGQKFYGPRIGALYARSPTVDAPLYPMIYGAGQERNFRPGTENTGMIAGLGKAAELVVQNIEKYESHLRDVRDYLESKLLETFHEKVHFNGKFVDSTRIPNTCNVSFRGENFAGGKVLSRCTHLQASVRAACHSSALTASPILLAIGIPQDIAQNSIRLSVGRHTTREDIDVVITDLKQALESFVE